MVRARRGECRVISMPGPSRLQCHLPTAHLHPCKGWDPATPSLGLNPSAGTALHYSLEQLGELGKGLEHQES